VAGVEFGKASLYAIEIEKAVLRSVDHQEWRGHGERRDVGIIEMLVKTGDDLGMADCIANVLFELRREGSHPADHHRGANTGIKAGEMTRAQTADGQTDTADTLFVHVLAGQEVIDGADVIPKHHARPGEAGGVNGSANELFALAGARVEGLDSFAGD